MSGHSKATDLPAHGEWISPDKLRVAKVLSLLVGAPALGFVYFLMFFRNSHDPANPGQGDVACYSYLFALSFFVTLGFGGLFWTILHHATNSGWGITVRRQMENIAGVLPWVLILMVPFWCPLVREDLWEWELEAKNLIHSAEVRLPAALAHETEKWEGEKKQVSQKLDRLKAILVSAKGKGTEAGGEAALLEGQEQVLAQELQRLERQKPDAASVKAHLMREKDSMLTGKLEAYFDGGYHAAYVRLGAYTVVFMLIVFLLRKWSIDNDKQRDPKLFLRSRYWSCFFIFPFALGFTFLVVDLIMALNYKWYSTMWGVYFFAGAALSSMALLILIVSWLKSLGYLRNVVTEEHYHLMGKFLLTFCIFWAYIAFSQYFLIWYSNITEETQFFLLRNSGGWNAVSIFLVVGHFFVPFVILLWRPVKKRAALLCAVCVWILLMHLLDMYWVVIPERAPSLTAAGGNPQLWTSGVWGVDVLSFVGVAGILTFAFLQILGRSSVYPCGDPRLEESIHVTN